MESAAWLHLRPARGAEPALEHTHRLTRVHGGTEIYDHVRYRLPFEPLASPIAPLTVGRWLDEIFDYRARRIVDALGR